jgi:glycosyltransferase involved in cell wall biosynthesis/transcriptional regulator with XRE-family HTH domain
MSEPRKLRILWNAQTPSLQTGYAVVTRNILTRLAATNLFEIGCLAWHEPPAPKPSYPHEGLNAYRFPFKLFSTSETPELKENQRYGQGNFEEIVEWFKPDVVVYLGDLFMSTWINDCKLRDTFHLALYYPIDGAPIPMDWIINLKRADSAICMSRFGTHITAQQVGKPPIYIPHGTNHKFWSEPYSLEEKVKLKKQYFGDPNVFVFGMVCRNQPRKNIPAFYEAFAYHSKGDPKHGIKGHPNSRILIHSAAVDKGWHLPALAAEYGIAEKVFLTDTDPHAPVSENQLRDFCRAMDVNVNTAWGEGWCLLPGTRFDTLERGLVPIESAVKGEHVISHIGNIQPITETTYRNVTNEKCSNIQVLGIGKNLSLSTTDNHKHYAIKRNGQSYNKIKKQIVEHVKPEWISAGDLKKGDFLLVPKPHLPKSVSSLIDIVDYVDGLEFNNTEVWFEHSYCQKNQKVSLTTIAKKVGCSFQHVSRILNEKQDEGIETNKANWRPLTKKIKELAKEIGYDIPEPLKSKRYLDLNDPDLAKFIGLYIAEGSSELNKCQTASHQKENLHHEIAKRIAKKYFNITPLKLDRENNKGTKLIFSSAVMSRLLSSLCGKGAFNKHIPDKFLNGPWIKDILWGFFYGDGSVSLDGIPSFTTVSPKLAKQLQLVFNNTNIFCNIQLDKQRARSNYPCFTLVINKDFVNSFIEWVKPYKYSKAIDPINFNNKKRIRTVINTASYFILSISKISHFSYTGKVYNLHINKDESYTCSGIATHNCLPVSDTLAMGIPNLMTNYTTGPELIQENYAGFLIDPAIFSVEPGSHIRRALIDINKLKTIMDKIVEDPSDLKSMGKSGKLGMEKYNWDNIIPIWIEFFKSIVSKVSKPHVSSEEI